MGCPLCNPSLFTLKFDSLPQFYFLKQLKTIKKRAFPRKVREILVQYEKSNLGIQFPFEEDLFDTTVKEKKYKARKGILNTIRNERTEIQ